MKKNSFVAIASLLFLLPSCNNQEKTIKDGYHEVFLTDFITYNGNWCTLTSGTEILPNTVHPAGMSASVYYYFCVNLHEVHGPIDLGETIAVKFRLLTQAEHDVVAQHLATGVHEVNIFGGDSLTWVYVLDWYDI